MVDLYNAKVTAMVVLIRRWASSTAHYQSVVCTFVNDKGQILTVEAPVHAGCGDIFWKRALIKEMKNTNELQFDHKIDDFMELFPVNDGFNPNGINIVEHIAYVEKKKDL